MTPSRSTAPWLAVPTACALAVMAGGVAAARPALALGGIGAALVVWLTVSRPVASIPSSSRTKRLKLEIPVTGQFRSSFGTVAHCRD